MDNISLYDDSALFGGDWLVGLQPIPGEPGQDQDGLKSIKSKTGGQSEDDLVKSLFTSMEDSMEQEMSDDPFDASWMDTKVDLMDLIMGADDDQEITTSVIEVQPLPLFGQDNLLPAEEPIGLNVLKDMAEKTAAELDLSSSTAEMIDLDDLGENLSVDVDSPEWISPVLSPVSPDDIDSVLSSGPSSPALSYQGADIDLVQMLNSYNESSSEQNKESAQILDSCTDSSSEYELEPPLKKSRSSPYEKPVRSVAERKSRKKQQNKDAATRYRQKKKAETDNIHEECTALELRNKELRDKVDQMTREIQYLKDLMTDVYKRKGLIKEKRK